MTEQAREDVALAAAIAAWQAQAGTAGAAGGAGHSAAGGMEPDRRQHWAAASRRALRRSPLGGRSGTAWRYGAGRRVRVWRRPWHCSWWCCSARQLRRRKLAALLPTGTATAAFLAEELPGEGLRLRAVTSVAVAGGKDLELWALPPGATRPDLARRHPSRRATPCRATPGRAPGAAHAVDGEPGAKRRLSNRAADGAGAVRRHADRLDHDRPRRMRPLPRVRCGQ